LLKSAVRGHVASLSPLTGPSLTRTQAVADYAVTDRTAGVFVVPVGSDARSIKKVTDEIKAVR
jgi:hypothetical protein